MSRLSAFASSPERVMTALRKRYARLHLKVNDAKSAVARAFGRKGMYHARRGNQTRKLHFAALGRTPNKKATLPASTERALPESW